VDVTLRNAGPETLALKICERIRSADRPMFALLMNEFCNEAGPAGLMRGTEASPGIPVKIFMEPIAIAITLLSNLAEAREGRS
jgi:hypothetical protein